MSGISLGGPIAPTDLEHVAGILLKLGRAGLPNAATAAVYVRVGAWLDDAVQRAKNHDRGQQDAKRAAELTTGPSAALAGIELVQHDNHGPGCTCELIAARATQLGQLAYTMAAGQNSDAVHALTMAAVALCALTARPRAMVELTIEMLREAANSLPLPDAKAVS